MVYIALFIYREITVMLLGDSNRCKNERRKNRRLLEKIKIT